MARGMIMKKHIKSLMVNIKFMEKLRILFVMFFALFVYSVSIGQPMTDIDRTKKKKKAKTEQRVTTPNPSTSTTKKKVSKTGRKKEVIFTISSNYAQFGATGGTKEFQVSSSGSWSISTGTASWGTLTRSGNSLTLRVASNSSSTARNDYFILSSGKKTLRVDISQSGETKFSISSTNATFDTNGGTKSFTVSSNNSWQIKTNTKSWGHLSRDGNVLTLRVDANPLTSERTDYFDLSSGNKTIRVNVSQSGETSLSLSTQNLNYSSSGGTQTINVTTNGTWDISVSTASWRHLEKRGDQLLVRVDDNYSSSSRTDYFSIRAGNKTVQVNITQSGRYSSSNYTSSSSYASSRYRRPFNSSQDDYWGGLSVGYIQKQWSYEVGGYKERGGVFENDKYLQGVQAGIRVDPQFGYGFGMNSGIFYEYCWAKSKNQYDDYGKYHYTYNEHGLYAPVDLKYTMNFSEWFQLSFYGGVGFNYVIAGNIKLNDDYGDESTDFFDGDNTSRFNMMLEYGAAVRIRAFQIDFSMSQGLNDWSDESGCKIKQGRPMTISATLCF